MILVTGGAGFIGSHTVEALLDAGERVRVLDLRPPPEGAEWVSGDVRDGEAVARAVGGARAVCHLAAMVGMGVDLDDLPDYVAHNDLGTAVLLRALHRADTVERVVLASSMVVYGEGRYACPTHGLVPAPPRSAADLDAGRFELRCPDCGGDLEPRAVPEDAPSDPRSVYAATKLQQEHLCAALARETGIPVTALRYHNVYGPRMPRDTLYAGVAGIFRSRLARGEPPLVFEDGGQRRDFVHVRDVARANVLALLAPEPVAGAINVASGRPRTVLDMATALAAAMDGPAPEVTGAWRGGDVRHVFASTRRAQERFGFSAEISFEEGMAELAYQTV